MYLNLWSIHIILCKAYASPIQSIHKLNVELISPTTLMMLENVYICYAYTLASTLVHISVYTRHFL